MRNTDSITVGELLNELSKLPPETKISFEGGLTYNQLKRWSDDEFVILFGEVQAADGHSLSKTGQVTFCDPDR